MNQNAWFMYFGDHPVRGKWGAHLEGQWRRSGPINGPQQLLLRPGVNHQLNASTMLTLGYAYVTTHRYGDHPITAAFPEHRIYQQVLVKQNAGTAALQHRFRLEQRFLGRMIPGEPKVDSWRYQNRFRYFLKAEVPVRGNWYAAFYNETFVNLAPRHGAHVFDQNRAYGALGYRLGKWNKIEVGYMAQLLSRRNSSILEANHTVQVSILSRLALGRR